MRKAFTIGIIATIVVCVAFPAIALLLGALALVTTATLLLLAAFDKMYWPWEVFYEPEEGINIIWKRKKIVGHRDSNTARTYFGYAIAGIPFLHKAGSAVKRQLKLVRVEANDIEVGHMLGATQGSERNVQVTATFELDPSHPQFLDMLRSNYIKNKKEVDSNEPVPDRFQKTTDEALTDVSTEVIKAYIQNYLSSISIRQSEELRTMTTDGLRDRLHANGIFVDVTALERTQDPTPKALELRNAGFDEEIARRKTDGQKIIDAQEVAKADALADVAIKQKKAELDADADYTKRVSESGGKRAGQLAQLRHANEVALGKGFFPDGDDD